MSRQYTVPAKNEGQRLDIALAAIADVSRSEAGKMIKNGLVDVDGHQPAASSSVAAGQILRIEDPEREVMPPAPDLKVLYQDNDVIAIDKPAGLAVHLSESGRPQATVAAFAAAIGVEDDDRDRPGIVHRLDKDTSGVMLLAKNPEAKAYLQAQFKTRQVHKRYIALVAGRMKEDAATINLPIARDRRRPTRRAVVPGGRPAVTHYQVTEELPGYSLLSIVLETGRTHQIRAHMAHLGHGVAGDQLYGGKTPPGLHRQFLHAADIEFTAFNGKPTKITSPLPGELTSVLNSLRTAAV